MFLFIGKHVRVSDQKVEFKYISCSYLSNVFPTFLHIIIFFYFPFLKYFLLFLPSALYFFFISYFSFRIAYFHGIANILAFFHMVILHMNNIIIKLDSHHFPYWLFQALPPQTHYHSSI